MEVCEAFNGRKINGGDNPTVEVRYYVLGTDDEAAATVALLAYAPATWGNAPRQPVPSVEQLSDLIWEGTVVYGFSNLTPPTEEEEEAAIQFSTKGGRAKITQSRGTRSYARDDAFTGTGFANVAPDYKGAIGVEKQGNSITVQGCEIVIPALAFTLTRRFSPGWLTAARLVSLHDLTGTTNATPFRSFAAGSLLFNGAEGSQKNSKQPVDVSFEFIGSKNVENERYGDISVPRKDGWEYLWFLYKEEEDADAKQLVKRPEAAYVETVYPAADHNNLGIT